MSQHFAFELNAVPRTETGKSVNRRLRREQKVPAIIYGADTAPEPISLELKDVMKALDHEAIYSHILTLKMGDKSQKVVIKALERHYIKPEVTHMDFQRIKAGEVIIMRVPLHFLGQEACPGVKEGGVVSQHMKDLEIKCLPENLPEYIEVNISALEIEHSLHLSQIKLPKGIELMMVLDEEHDPTVVSVHRPRIEKEEVPEELTAEAAAEAAPQEEAGEKKQPGE